MYFVAWSEFPFSLAMPSPRTRHTERAIISSSSVRMTRTVTRLAVRGNHARIRRVSRFFEFDSKESQPIADPGADRGRILSDAASEHQRVQSAQRRRECADPFLDLVAKQRDRFSRPHVLRFTASSKSRMSELVSDTPSSPDWKLTISLNCFAVIFSVRARYQTSPGIEIA